MPSDEPVHGVDPFDLPEWLARPGVVWVAHSRVRDEHHVTGELASGEDRLGCDLLAADRAFPRPVLPERWRREVHQAWTYGQVVLVEHDRRLTVAVPGSGFTADLVLESLTRLARAVGGAPENLSVTLRL